MPFPCRAHALPLPCRAPKGLECVSPTWFTQCCRVWFTLEVPCPCHAPTMPFFSRPRHSTAVSRRPFCVMDLRITAWSDHGMTSMNQTRLHCVNRMGKTHSKPLAARHGRGTAWARHGHGTLFVNRHLMVLPNVKTSALFFCQFTYPLAHCHMCCYDITMLFVRSSSSEI